MCTVRRVGSAWQGRMPGACAAGAPARSGVALIEKYLMVIRQHVT
jgi:hypothetical protein